MPEQIEWKVDQFGQLCRPSLHDSVLVEIQHKPGELNFVIRKDAYVLDFDVTGVEDIAICEYRGMMGIADIEIWDIGLIDDVLWDRSRIAWRNLLGATGRKEKNEFHRYFRQKQIKSSCI